MQANPSGELAASIDTRISVRVALRRNTAADFLCDGVTGVGRSLSCVNHAFRLKGACILLIERACQVPKVRIETDEARCALKKRLATGVIGQPVE
jgi:hypothetical protein